jgi:hypothetical protein
LLSILRKATGWERLHPRLAAEAPACCASSWTGSTPRTPKRPSPSRRSTSGSTSAPSRSYRGKIIVTDFDVDGPYVFVRRPTSRVTRFPPTSFSASIPISSAPRSSRNVFIQDATATNLKLTLARTAVDGSLDTSDGFIGKAVIGLNPTFWAIWRRPPTSKRRPACFPPARKVALKASLARSGLTVDSLLFDSEKVTLTAKAKTNGDLKRGGIDLSGTLDVPSVLTGQLSFEAEADLKDGKADIKKVERQAGGAPSTPPARRPSPIPET